MNGLYEKLETIYIPALRHDMYGWQEAKEPTCILNGCIAHDQCRRCKLYFDADGAVIEGEVIIPANGHSYSAFTEEEPATCTKPGMRGYYTCTVCLAYFDENKKPVGKFELRIEPKGHTYAEEWTITGISHWHASTCGCGVRKDEEEHSWEQSAYGHCPVCGLTLGYTGGLLFKEDGEGGYLVYDYVGISPEVIVPAEYNGAPVTAVGDRGAVFSQSKFVTKVTLPDTVVKIGGYAFRDCGQLAELVLSSNVETIGSYAFYGCASLESIAVPAATQMIGTGAFQNCTSLSSVSFGQGDVPLGIGDFAFKNCVSLQEIALPARTEAYGITMQNEHIFNVTGIFAGCASLTDVTVPFVMHEYLVSTLPIQNFGQLFGTEAYEGGVPVVQYYGDSGAIPQQETYYIPAGLRSVTVLRGIVWSYTFENCTMLTEIDVSGVEDTVGMYTFRGCTGIRSLAFGAVTSVGRYAFEGCTALQSVTFASPEMTGIGMGAFKGCTSLVSIDLPSGITTASTELFRGCTALEEVTFGSEVTVVGYNAFDGCVSLASAEFLSSVRSLRGYAFRGCTSLEEVVVNVGQFVSEETLGKGVFEGCTSLRKVTIAEGVEIIPQDMLRGCTALRTLVLPSTVISIREGAFADCTYLSAIVIKTVGSMEIGAGVFSGCASLAKVYTDSHFYVPEGNGNDAYINAKKLPLDQYTGEEA